MASRVFFYLVVEVFDVLHFSERVLVNMYTTDPSSRLLAQLSQKNNCEGSGWETVQPREEPLSKCQGKTFKDDITESLKGHC